ncbi:hypothetical protein [Amycolatopsis methanolica]|uniref:hypothetical protein n=1 Tax=Amycolatopsis methanolica TaxID=1814 RepID=UPI0034291F17
MIHIDPGGDRYLSAVRGVGVWPALFTSGIDDFDFAGGKLYGVTNTFPFSGRVVRIDPVSGWTHPASGPVLPLATAYGSIVLAGETLYGTARRRAGRSRTLRVARDGSEPVAGVSAGVPLSEPDSAGCPRAPAPPPPRPAPPPPPVAQVSTQERTEEKHGWSFTVLVLILGAGIAVRRLSR